MSSPAPSRSCAILSSDRIRMSLPPPVAYGTTKLMARAGKPDAVFLSSVEVGAAGAALVATPPPPHAAIVMASTEVSASERRRIAVRPSPSPRAATVSTIRVMAVGTDFVSRTEDLKYERRGAVGILTFNRPDARNAMTWDMYQGLFDACEHVDSDDRVRVLVLRGAGDKAFVAGTDISQFKKFTTPQHAIDYEKNQNRNVGRVEQVKKPTIAMIRGFAVGGGASIALACDLRIAATDARLGVPIAKTLGNTLSITTLARIVSYVGPARTKELLFTARLIDAEEGKAAGVFNEVVEPERLEARTLEIAEQIAANAPLTIKSVKEGVRRLMEHARIDEADDLVQMAYQSDDFKEGIDAFLNKRAPKWTGR
jgi:enoyl-CoA hydratase/carnithine racemase